MSSDARSAAEAYKLLLESKIQQVVAEFAEGKLSREQFQILYERYNSKLSIATHALMSGNPEAVRIAQDGLSTVFVKESYQGKAIGLMIYHQRSRKILETLGSFAIPIDTVLSTIKTFDMLLEANEFVEYRVERMDERRWLLYSPGKQTVVITLFHNEPSQQQIREIERLQHDFEQANLTLLQADEVKPDELAYPLIAFIQRRFRKSK